MFKYVVRIANREKAAKFRECGEIAKSRSSNMLYESLNREKAAKFREIAKSGSSNML